MPARYPLKGIVDFSDHFERLPLVAILGAGLVASAAAARAWESAWAGLAFALFALGDGVMLAALPRFQRSFGPIQLPWLSLMGLRLLATWPFAWISGAAALFGAGLLQVLLSITATYACWIEPARLGLTRITLRSPHLDGCPALRLLHISDLHVERLTRREHELLKLVEQCEPDVIVLTGDYLNISFTYDAVAHRHARDLLARLQATAGVYAISGSPPVDPSAVVARLLEGLDIVWLRDEMRELAWHGCTLQVAGLACSYDLRADAQRLQRVIDGRKPVAYTVLLYHTPDLMPAAAKARIDLYLAGHTHGGQLRLPLFGALLTASRHGKRYEMGMYREGNTTLYVNRGVGLEGKGAPRARFLCPPELVLFTLQGTRE